MQRHPFTAVCGLLLLLTVPFTACSSTDGNKKADPLVEAEWAATEAQRNAQIQATNDFHATLLNMDKSMDKYAEASARDGNNRAEQIADKISSYLRRSATKHVDMLMLTADDQSDRNVANRARAVGALGFYDPVKNDKNPRDVLTPLLNALLADDPAVVNNAVFALGVLRHPRTPIDTLGVMLEDRQREERQRVGLANTLVQVQETSLKPETVRPYWQRLLLDPTDTEEDPWVLVQALRGLGRLRHGEDADLAAPYLNHPTPLVREAAAIALGYQKQRRTHEPLIARLEADEINPNVRLAVRKALQALAGGTDRGYDVKQWRRVFSDQ